MTTAAPEVSIVMPSYNQAWFLEHAINSVRRQVFQDFELIVVNDGSTDDTAKVAQNSLDLLNHEGKFQLIHLPMNAGSANAINVGCEYARGKYWTWISSDNAMSPEWLSYLVPELRKGAGAAYGAYRRCVVTDRNTGGYMKETKWYFRPYDPARLVSTEECYFGPAFLINADIWREAGPHRGSICHDYDHWTRVEEACWKNKREIVGLEVPLCDYLVHDERVTVVRKTEFDAGKWRSEALARRSRETADA